MPSSIKISYVTLVALSYACMSNSMSLCERLFRRNKTQEPTKEVRAVEVKKTYEYAYPDLVQILPKVLWGIIREYCTHEPYGSPMYCRETYPYAIAFSPDDRYIITESTVSTEKIVQIFDRNDGQCVLVLNPSVSFVSYINSLTMEDWNTIMHKGCDSRDPIFHRVYNQNNKCIHNGLRRPDNIAVCSPNHHYLAIREAGYKFDGTQLWDCKTAQNSRELKLLHKLDVYACVMAFSHDSTRLATGDSTGCTWIWNCATGKRLHTLIGHRQKISALAFSPENSYLAISSHDQTVSIWDCTSGKKLQKIATDDDVVRAMAFDATSSVLATVDSTLIRCYAKPQLTTPSHNNKKESREFSP